MATALKSECCVSLVLVSWLALCNSVQADEKADRLFGEAQFGQMLTDRPDVKPVFDRDPTLSAWTIDMFSGLSGQRIYWVHGEPPDSVSICSPIGSEIAFIQVTDGKLVSSIDRCVTIIFELHNTRQAHVQLVAAMKSLSKSDFVDLGVRLEYRALILTKRLLSRSKIRAMVRDTDQFAASVINAPEDYQKFLDRYRGADGELQSPNHTYWENYYESHKQSKAVKN